MQYYDSIASEKLLNDQDQLNLTEHNNLIQKRVRMRIPQNYHQEPIISSLVEKYGLKVNILAAILGANGAGDGWFDLALIGIPEKVNAALIYLSELEIEIWLEGINNDIW